MRTQASPKSPSPQPRRPRRAGRAGSARSCTAARAPSRARCTRRPRARSPNQRSRPGSPRANQTQVPTTAANWRMLLEVGHRVRQRPAEVLRAVGRAMVLLVRTGDAGRAARLRRGSRAGEDGFPARHAVQDPLSARARRRGGRYDRHCGEDPRGTRALPTAAPLPRRARPRGKSSAGYSFAANPSADDAVAQPRCARRQHAIAPAVSAAGQRSKRVRITGPTRSGEIRRIRAPRSSAPASPEAVSAAAISATIAAPQKSIIHSKRCSNASSDGLPIAGTAKKGSARRRILEADVAVGHLSVDDLLPVALVERRVLTG